MPKLQPNILFPLHTTELISAIKNQSPFLFFASFLFSFLQTHYAYLSFLIIICAHLKNTESSHSLQGRTSYFWFPSESTFRVPNIKNSVNALDKPERSNTGVKTLNDTMRKPTCSVQFSVLFKNSTKRSTTPAVAMTSSMGGLGSVRDIQWTIGQKLIQ